MTVKKWSADAWAAVKGDGCTGIPDLYMERPCERHDRHYTFHTHSDGTPISRLSADWELAKDTWKALPVMSANKRLWWMAPIRLVAKNVLPVVVFIGVRIGGAPHWDTE